MGSSCLSTRFLNTRSLNARFLDRRFLDTVEGFLCGFRAFCVDRCVISRMRLQAGLGACSTTGGQRLHRREDLERSLISRGISPASFESHLRMFELGMPPHGGFAIGLERLTAQVLGLPNIREATLYPRDRYRLTP